MAIKNLALNREVFDSCSGVENRITLLTNGKNGVPSSRYASEWVYFGKDIEKRLFVDLGANFGITGFDMGFLHDKQSGICPPSDVKLLLSENGNDYYEVSTVNAPYNASFNMCTRAVYSEKFGKPICARYAIVTFGLDGETYADELRIFGDDYNGNEAILYGEKKTFEDKNCFATPSKLDSVKDIFSVRFGGEDKKSLGIEDFISCVAFVDSMEMPRDTMSDAFCFDYEGKTETLSDWEEYLDSLFAKNRNIDALDKVVGLIKTTLGLDENHKYKIFIKTPSPKVSLEPFGDLNGDGIVEKLLQFEDCIKAYSWFLDEVIRRFNGCGSENLAFGGFVWGKDRLSRTEREDVIEFARACVEEIHKRNKKCVFVANFGASGCEKTEYIGFDCVLMKPDSVVSALAPVCKKYGFGVALETDNAFLDNLCGCIENGMMSNTVHMYCQAENGRNISTFAYSRNQEEQTIYQKLYEFIKDGKEYVPPVYEERTVSISELIKTPEPEIVEEVIVEPITEPEIVEEVIVEPITEPEIVEEVIVEPITEPEVVEEVIVEPITEPEVVEEVVEPVTEPEIVEEVIVEPITEPEIVEEVVVEPITEPEIIEEVIVEPITEPEIVEEVIDEPVIELNFGEEFKSEPEETTEDEPDNMPVIDLKFDDEPEKEIKIELALDLTLPPEFTLDQNSDLKLELEGFSDDVSIPEIKFDIKNIFGEGAKQNPVQKDVSEQELKKTEIIVEKPVVTHVAPVAAAPITRAVEEPVAVAVAEPVIKPVAEPVIPPVIEPETKVFAENFPQAPEIQQPIAEFQRVARNGKHKKMAMMGAGVAATLGMAYVIAKALKGKD